MNIKAILFDLDGTLLPMDMKVFQRNYFASLYKKAIPDGAVSPEVFVNGIYAGIKAMVGNDGSRTNEQAFWASFGTVIVKDNAEIKRKCDSYYTEEFNALKACTVENPLAREAVRIAGAGGRRVVLATNPMFPMVAQVTRMSWVGLSTECFDLVTAYEEERFCKPNPEYYRSICQRLGVSPEECLMVGNDETEDIIAASSIGMKCFFVTDCAIPAEPPVDTGAEKGSFAELIEWLKTV